jgi:hypothetical protein
MDVGLLKALFIIISLGHPVTAGPPQINNPPKNVVVTVGGRAQFTCHAEGVANYVWLTNKTQSLPRRWRASDNLLVLDEVGSDDACVVTCRAENEDGMTQASATLTVIDFLLPTQSSSPYPVSDPPQPVGLPRWKATPYSPCSSTCEGFKIRNITCVRQYSDQSYRQVNDMECYLHSVTIRPKPQRACGTECPGFKYSYVFVSRGPCNATCNSSGIQWVTSQCKSRVNKTVVNIDLCAGLERPRDYFHECFVKRSCSPARWWTGVYGPCHSDCQGYQIREVNCRRSDRQSRNYIVDINDCWREDFRAQPIAVRPCGTECRDRLFKYGRYWGPCNASCGLSGVKTLYFPCYSKKNGSVVSAEACGDLPPPPKGIHQPCNRVSCSQNALEGKTFFNYSALSN